MIEIKFDLFFMVMFKYNVVFLSKLSRLSARRLRDREPRETPQIKVMSEEAPGSPGASEHL
jgi:hypothetical protein